MLVKKKVMLLHDLEENGIDYVKEVCGYDFIQKLSDIYYTHSTDDKNKSDWVITTTNLMNLSQEISFLESEIAERNLKNRSAIIASE